VHQSSTTLDFNSEVDDYGVAGTNYISRLDSIYFQDVTAPASYSFSVLTGWQYYFPAIGGDFDYGPIAIDNTTISAPLANGTNAAAKLDFELDFPTTSGHTSFVESSPDLIQWVIIETVAGTGLTMVRYYPTTPTSQFFRVVQE